MPSPLRVARAHVAESGGADRLPLVGKALRPWVALTTALAIAALAGVGATVWHSARPVLFDRAADASLVRTLAPEHGAAVLLSEVGEPKVFVLITAVVVIAFLLLRDLRAASCCVVRVGVALLLVEAVFKPLFDRRLGDLPGPTFPSGHTAVALALACTVLLAAGRNRPLGRALGVAGRIAVSIVLLGAACTIGIAMVSLRFHYLSDVVVAVPLGCAVAGCSGLAVDAVAGRLHPMRA